MNKTAATKRSFGRTLFYFLLIFAFLFFIMESLLSIAYYQKNGGSLFATTGFINNMKNKFLPAGDRSVSYRNQQLARPDSSAEMNKTIADEAIEANGFEYQPWVGYSAKSYHGKYLTIDGLIRKTIPETSADSSSADTLLIYFLGGSTMFGYNVTDAETIPAYFVKQYKGGNYKLPVKVVNFSIPSYYSYNELMLLTNLLYSGKRPDLVLFFDGLNDFIAAKASPFKKPILYYRMAQAFSMDINKGNRNYSDSMDFVFTNSPGSSIPSLSDSMYQNYISTVASIETISKAYGVKSFFFVQPVPYYNYPNQKKDSICSQLDYPQYKYIYPKLEAEAANRTDFFFLGNMLSNETGITFVDKFHYSPKINEKIAAAMLEKIHPFIDSLTKK